MKWNAEETGTRLLFVCKRNIPIEVAQMKAGATQAPRMWKQNVNQSESIGKMVAETLSLDLSTVNKNTCLKSTPNYSRKSHSSADKCRA